MCGGRGRCGWEGPEWGHLLRMLRDVVFAQPQVRKYTSTYVCSEASKVLLCGSCLRELRGPKPRHARHSSPGPQPKPRFAQSPSHGPKPRHATQSLYTYVQRQFCTRFLNRQRGAIMRRDCAVVLLLVLGLLLTWPREWARLCWVSSGGQPGGCHLDLVLGAVDSSVYLSCSVSGCRCSQVPLLHACRTH